VLTKLKCWFESLEGIVWFSYLNGIVFGVILTVLFYEQWFNFKSGLLILGLLYLAWNFYRQLIVIRKISKIEKKITNILFPEGY